MTFDLPLVLLILFLTFVLWRVQKPERLKKKFLTALLHSKPIVPKHQPPEGASEGFKISPFSPEGDQRFFDDFQDFANVMDWWWTGGPGRSPWRLQELPEPASNWATGICPCTGAAIPSSTIKSVSARSKYIAGCTTAQKRGMW
jgi:hypothetical protein